jgi:hypothetical protein
MSLDQSDSLDVTATTDGVGIEAIVPAGEPAIPSIILSMYKI